MKRWLDGFVDCITVKIYIYIYIYIYILFSSNNLSSKFDLYLIIYTYMIIFKRSKRMLNT